MILRMAVMLGLLLASMALALPCIGDEGSGTGGKETPQILKPGAKREVNGSLRLDDQSSLSIAKNSKGLTTLRMEQGDDSVAFLLEKTEIVSLLVHDKQTKRVICLVGRWELGLYYTGVVVIEKSAKTSEWQMYRCLDRKALGASKTKDAWIEDVEFVPEQPGTIRLKIGVENYEGKGADRRAKRKWILQELDEVKEREPLAKEKIIGLDEESEEDTDGGSKDADSEGKGS